MGVGGIPGPQWRQLTRLRYGPNVATEVEIIQPEGYEIDSMGTGSRDAESIDSVQTGNPLLGYSAGLLAVLAVAAFLFSLGGSDTEPIYPEQATTTLAPRGEASPVGETDDPTNQTDGAHNAEIQARRSSITQWSGGQSLIVIENAQFVYELDLSTSRRTSWSPPERLLDTDPLIIGEELVVIGESGAWIGKPLEPQWRFLAEADRVLPSTEPGLMWLQNPIAVSDAGASDFWWTEVDAAGQVYRTMRRDGPVVLPTPEIAVGSQGGVVRFTGSEVTPWQPLSTTGVIVAAGLGDIVVAECDANRSCDRVWYDPSNSRPRNGFYPDLAKNLDVDLGAVAQLSPNGRFVVSSSSAAPLTVTSVANGQTIDNACVSIGEVVWAAGSELFTCTTPAGSELFETETGTSLGMVVLSADKWQRMAFISTDKILQPSR